MSLEFLTERLERHEIDAVDIGIIAMAYRCMQAHVGEENNLPEKFLIAMNVIIECLEDANQDAESYRDRS